MKQKYIKALDVAEMFGVTRQTIRNWVNKGLLNDVMIEGTQFIHLGSLNKLKGKLESVSLMEESVDHYKEELENEKQNYVEILADLRDCCNGNKALVANKVTLAKFLPIVYGVISPNHSENDRGSVILQMLLSGDDIQKIANHFELSYMRILQIVNEELIELQGDAESYRALKEERDKLLEEVEVLRINARSCEAIKAATKQVEDVKPNILTQKLCEFNLSVRALNCCRSAGIHTVADLVERTSKEIMDIRCMGKKTLDELRDFLSDIGLDFGKTYIVNDDGTIMEVIINQ